MRVVTLKEQPGIAHMDTIKLLNTLNDYTLLLSKIKEREIADPTLIKETDSIFIGSISLRYNFISLKLDFGKKLPSSHRYLLSRYFECTFNINQQQISYTETYCQRKSRHEGLQSFVLENAPTAWVPEKAKSIYSEETQRYLTLADSIAQCGYQCAAGDDYYPGYYSEIVIEENKIILRQINHWNSRSLNHRYDYHLRDLEFFIPLQPIEEKPSFHDYQIGKMFINFSDSSSTNNKECGDRIKAMILQTQAST